MRVSVHSLVALSVTPEKMKHERSPYQVAMFAPRSSPINGFAPLW